MDIKIWKYPGGEVGVRLENPLSDNELHRIQNSDDLVALLMAADCAKHRGEPLKTITIPYLPYARQDRVVTIGDPNAVDVLAHLIKAAAPSLQRVTCYDVHSRASIDSFANLGIELVSLDPTPFIKRFVEDIGEKNVFLIAPDKGSTEKTKRYFNALRAQETGDHFAGVIHCVKKRDPVTGKLKHFEIENMDVAVPSNASFVIADDICDGGRTFLGVHDALEAAFGLRPTYLFTTHGIFSQGVEFLLTKFRKLGSTDTFSNTIVHPNLIIYPIPEGVRHYAHSDIHRDRFL